MESQLKLDNNGQELQQGDVNTVGRVAALSGDIALQQVLALAPALSAGSVKKAIVPLWDPGPVTAAGPSGKIRIYPFLAVVGSRTDATTNAIAWKDIRSQIFTSEDSLGTLYKEYAIASNASGNPRWDLIYVTVSVDTDDTAVTRYVKTPPSLVATATSVAVTKSTKLTLNTATGTPGASPAKPAIPADSGSNYNIPICYVRVGNGTGGTSLYSMDEIQEAPSVVSLSHRTGTAICGPASGQYDPALPMLATRQPWPASSNRPRAYLPPSMQGMVGKIIALDLGSAPNTAASGDILDNTIDWRHRVFKWTVQLRSSRNLAWDNLAVGSLVVPDTLGQNASFVGMGQSFTLNNTGAVARGSLIAAIGGTGSSWDFQTAILPSTGKLAIYVDQDTGELKLYLANSPGCAWVFWIEASGQYYNSIQA